MLCATLQAAQSRHASLLQALSQAFSDTQEKPRRLPGWLILQLGQWAPRGRTTPHSQGGRYWTATETGHSLHWEEVRAVHQGAGEEKVEFLGVRWGKGGTPVLSSFRLVRAHTCRLREKGGTGEGGSYHRGTGSPGFWHELAVQPWGCHLTSLGLHLTIGSMDVADPIYPFIRCELTTKCVPSTSLNAGDPLGSKGGTVFALSVKWRLEKETEGKCDACACGKTKVRG